MEEDVLFLLQETMNVQERQCSQCRNYLQRRGGGLSSGIFRDEDVWLTRSQLNLSSLVYSGDVRLKKGAVGAGVRATCPCLNAATGLYVHSR